MTRLPHRRWPGVAVATAVLGALAGPACMPAGAASPSASTLWNQAKAAAHAAGSLHYVSVDSPAGYTQTIVGDVNRVEGTQLITLRSTPRNTTSFNFSVTVTLVGHVAYVHGGADALATIIGLTDAQAIHGAGEWISITPSDRLYSQTAAALTTGSVIANFDMKGPYTLGTHRRVGGADTVALNGYLTGEGKTAVHQTFEIKASGSPLPLASSSPPVGTKVARLRNAYSRWGEPVSVSAPSHAVPLRRLPRSTTTTAPQVVTAAATSISTAPPLGSDATPTAERV